MAVETAEGKPQLRLLAPELAGPSGTYSWPNRKHSPGHFPHPSDLLSSSFLVHHLLLFLAVGYIESHGSAIKCAGLLMHLPCLFPGESSGGGGAGPLGNPTWLAEEERLVEWLGFSGLGFDFHGAATAVAVGR